MSWRTEKPRKPYKNIGEFAKRIGTYSKWRKQVGDFPCVECGGRGSVHDERDYDCVEGYKLAPLYCCKKCNGTGTMPSKEFRKEYKKIVDKWKEETKKWKEADQHRKNALKKLSKEEIEAIKWLGL